jgi:hypothetical protein
MELKGVLNLKITIEDIDTENQASTKLSLFSDNPIRIRQNLFEAVEYVMKKMGYLQFGGNDGKGKRSGVATPGRDRQSTKE